MVYATFDNVARLLVLGNAGLDIGLRLPALPRPGETLLGTSSGRAPGGKGLNQAVVAARTDLAPVLFYAPVGDDAEGREVARAIATEPFAQLDLPVLTAPTDVSVLMVLPDGENAIVSAGDCAFALSSAAAAAFAGQCAPGDWLLLQGNLLALVTETAIEAARARGGRVMLNTAPINTGMARLLPGCDLVVANESEARQLTPDAPPGPATAAALRAASGGYAVVTLGAAGCLIAADGETRHAPAPAVQTVDTTGAGDTFCGVLAAALVAGWPLTTAIAAAQEAAALVVTRPGAFTALPSGAELRRLLARY